MNNINYYKMQKELCSGKKNRRNKKGKFLWRLVAAVVMWSIWLERNNKVFNDSLEPIEEVWDRIN